MRAFFTWLNNLYPVWLVGLATVAFLRPETMRWFDAPWIFGALAASMLCMGLSLNPADQIGVCGPTVAVITFVLVTGGIVASLARQHFAALPLAAAAGVFSGVMQNVIGGIAVAIWKRQPPTA